MAPDASTSGLRTALAMGAAEAVLVSDPALAGSVQKFGNRVKITARLSRASTNEELWSRSFGPQELTDVFEMQSELAHAIVAELRGRLTGEAAKSEIHAQVQAAERARSAGASPRLRSSSGPSPSSAPPPA